MARRLSVQAAQSQMMTFAPHASISTIALGTSAPARHQWECLEYAALSLFFTPAPVGALPVRDAGGCRPLRRFSPYPYNQYLPKQPYRCIMTSSEILHNLPQIITAVAALITAITGLIKVMKDKGKD